MIRKMMTMSQQYILIIIIIIIIIYMFIVPQREDEVTTNPLIYNIEQQANIQSSIRQQQLFNDPSPDGQVKDVQRNLYRALTRTQKLARRLKQAKISKKNVLATVYKTLAELAIQFSLFLNSARGTQPLNKSDQLPDNFIKQANFALGYGRALNAYNGIMRELSKNFDKNKLKELSFVLKKLSSMTLSNGVEIYKDQLANIIPILDHTKVYKQQSLSKIYDLPSTDDDVSKIPQQQETKAGIETKIDSIGQKCTLIVDLSQKQVVALTKYQPSVGEEVMVDSGGGGEDEENKYQNFAPENNGYIQQTENRLIPYADRTVSVFQNRLTLYGNRTIAMKQQKQKKLVLSYHAILSQRLIQLQKMAKQIEKMLTKVKRQRFIGRRRLICQLYVTASDLLVVGSNLLIQIRLWSYCLQGAQNVVININLMLHQLKQLLSPIYKVALQVNIYNYYNVSNYYQVNYQQNFYVQNISNFLVSFDKQMLKKELDLFSQLITHSTKQNRNQIIAKFQQATQPIKQLLNKNINRGIDLEKNFAVVIDHVEEALKNNKSDMDRLNSEVVQNRQIIQQQLISLKTQIGKNPKDIAQLVKNELNGLMKRQFSDQALKASLKQVNQTYKNVMRSETDYLLKSLKAFNIRDEQIIFKRTMKERQAQYQIIKQQNQRVFNTKVDQIVGKNKQDLQSLKNSLQGIITQERKQIDTQIVEIKKQLQKINLVQGQILEQAKRNTATSGLNLEILSKLENQIMNGKRQLQLTNEMKRLYQQNYSAIANIIISQGKKGINSQDQINKVLSNLYNKLLQKSEQNVRLQQQNFQKIQDNLRGFEKGQSQVLSILNINTSLLQSNKNQFSANINQNYNKLTGRLSQYANLLTSASQNDKVQILARLEGMTVQLNGIALALHNNQIQVTQFIQPLNTNIAQISTQLHALVSNLVQFAQKSGTKLDYITNTIQGLGNRLLTQMSIFAQQNKQMLQNQSIYMAALNQSYKTNQNFQNQLNRGLNKMNDTMVGGFDQVISNQARSIVEFGNVNENILAVNQNITDKINQTQATVINVGKELWQQMQSNNQRMNQMTENISQLRAHNQTLEMENARKWGILQSILIQIGQQLNVLIPDTSTLRTIEQLQRAIYDAINFHADEFIEFINQNKSFKNKINGLFKQINLNKDDQNWSQVLAKYIGQLSKSKQMAQIELQKLKQINGTLQRQKSRLSDKKHNLQSKISQEKSSLQKQEIIHSNKQQQLQRVKMQLQNARFKLNQSNFALQNLNLNYTKSQTKAQNLSENLQKSQAQVVKLNGELKLLTEQMNQKMVKLGKLEKSDQRVATKSNQVKKLVTELEELKFTMASVKMAKGAAESQVVIKNNQITQLQEKIILLKNEITIQKNASENSKNILNNEIQLLRTKIKTLTEQYSQKFLTLQNDKLQLKAKIANLNAQITANQIKQEEVAQIQKLASLSSKGYVEEIQNLKNKQRDTIKGKLAQLRSKQQQLQSAKEQLIRLRGKVQNAESLKSQNQKLKQENQGITKQIATLSAKIQKFAAQIENLNNQLLNQKRIANSNMQSKVQAYQNQLNTLEQDKKKLKRQLLQAKSDYSRVDKLNEQMKTKLSDFKELKAQNERNIDKLGVIQEQRQRYIKKVGESNILMVRKSEQLNKSQASIKSLQRQKEQLVEGKNRLQSSLESLKQTFDKVETQKMKLTTAQIKMLGQISTIKAQLKSLKQKNQTAVNELQQTTLQLKTAQGRVTQLEQQTQGYDKLKKKLSSFSELEKKKLELEQKLKKAQKDIQNLTKSQTTLKGVASQLNDKIQKSQQAIDNANKRIQKAEKSIKTLEAQKQRLNNVLTKEMKDKKDIIEQKQKVDEALQNLKQTLGNSNSQIQDLKRKVKDGGAEASKAALQLTNLKRLKKQEIQKLQLQVKTKQQTIQQLQKTVNSSNDQKNAKQAEITAKSAQISKLQEKLAQVSGQLANSSQKLSEKEKQLKQLIQKQRLQVQLLKAKKQEQQIAKLKQLIKQKDQLIERYSKRTDVTPQQVQRMRKVIGQHTQMISNMKNFMKYHRRINQSYAGAIGILHEEIEKKNQQLQIILAQGGINQNTQALANQILGYIAQARIMIQQMKAKQQTVQKQLDQTNIQSQISGTKRNFQPNPQQPNHQPQKFLVASVNSKKKIQGQQKNPIQNPQKTPSLKKLAKVGMGNTVPPKKDQPKPVKIGGVQAQNPKNENPALLPPAPKYFMTNAKVSESYVEEQTNKMQQQQQQSNKYFGYDGIPINQRSFQTHQAKVGDNIQDSLAEIEVPDIFVEENVNKKTKQRYWEEAAEKRQVNNLKVNRTFNGKVNQQNYSSIQNYTVYKQDIVGEDPLQLGVGNVTTNNNARDYRKFGAQGGVHDPKTLVQNNVLNKQFLDSSIFNNQSQILPKNANNAGNQDKDNNTILDLLDISIQQIGEKNILNMKGKFIGGDKNIFQLKKQFQGISEQKTLVIQQQNQQILKLKKRISNLQRIVVDLSEIILRILVQCKQMVNAVNSVIKQWTQLTNLRSDVTKLVAMLTQMFETFKRFLNDLIETILSGVKIYNQNDLVQLRDIHRRFMERF